MANDKNTTTIEEEVITQTEEDLTVTDELVNNVIELYVSLILKGKRTIEQVPARIREDVRKLLAEEGVTV